MKTYATGEKIDGNGGFEAVRLMQEKGSTFVRMNLPVGGKVGEHSSDAKLFVYVIEGKIIYRSGKSGEVCPKGTLISDEPGNIHSLENDDIKETELLIIKIEK